MAKKTILDMELGPDGSWVYRPDPPRPRYRRKKKRKAVDAMKLNDPVERAIQRQERDQILEVLKERRRELIEEARKRARALALRRKRRGYPPHVHAPEILKALRMDPKMKPLLEGLDPRWMGPVFRTPEWRPTGKTVNAGTHARPARIWELIG